VTIDKIHPEVRAAMLAIENPEVQGMVRRLAEFGLGVMVPHSHTDQGEFLPLPSDKVSFEQGLRVSFKDKDDPALQSSIAVGWRWDAGTQTIARCQNCMLAVCSRGCV